MTPHGSLMLDPIPAFAAGTPATGAMLPEEGRTALTRAGGPPPAVFDAVGDGWAEADVPVLVRGEGRARVRIVPLAWSGEPGGGYSPEADPPSLDALWSALQSAGLYWAGNWRTLDELDELAEREREGSGGAGHGSIASYLAALRTAGATRANVWKYSETTGLALVRVDGEAGQTTSLALHIVPASWVSGVPIGVSKRRSRDWVAVEGIDLRWAWSEVVALHEERMRLLDGIDLSDAVVRFLAKDPASAEAEFRAGFASEAACGAGRIAVRALLLETMRIQPDWTRPLDGIGAEVAAVMGDRHPELSSEARERLGRYFTRFVAAAGR